MAHNALSNVYSSTDSLNRLWLSWHILYTEQKEAKLKRRPKEFHAFPVIFEPLKKLHNINSKEFGADGHSEDSQSLANIHREIKLWEPN